MIQFLKDTQRGQLQDKKEKFLEQQNSRNILNRFSNFHLFVINTFTNYYKTSIFNMIRTNTKRNKFIT